jgi:hypothetical protein
MSGEIRVPIEEAIALTKGDLELNILPIAQRISQALNVEDDLDPKAAWVLLTRNILIAGSDNVVDEWIDGNDVFGPDFQQKPLSEMLESISESNFGKENYAIKLARDGRVFVQKSSSK